MAGGKSIVANDSVKFSAVTEAVAQMDEIQDAHEGMGFGGWVFLGFLAALVLALVICTIRKLTSVRIN